MMVRFMAVIGSYPAPGPSKGRHNFIPFRTQGKGGESRFYQDSSTPLGRNTASTGAALSSVALRFLDEEFLRGLV